MIQETPLAKIRFRPWFEEGGPRERWAITIEFLDQRADDKWLERQFRATVWDEAEQVIAQRTANKPEGGLTRDAMESACHQLGEWYAFPDHGAFSVDWLCGYFFAARKPEFQAHFEGAP